MSSASHFSRQRRTIVLLNRARLRIGTPRLDDFGNQGFVLLVANDDEAAIGLLEYFKEFLGNLLEQIFFLQCFAQGGAHVEQGAKFFARLSFQQLLLRHPAD